MKYMYALTVIRIGFVTLCLTYAVSHVVSYIIIDLDYKKDGAYAYLSYYFLLGTMGTHARFLIFFASHIVFLLHLVRYILTSRMQRKKGSEFLLVNCGF